MVDINKEKVVRHATKLGKHLLFFLSKPFSATMPAFILGCGRSGTTMMVKTFQHDTRLEVLGENDPKIAEDFMLVYEKLEKAIENSKAPIFVVKPILNSFDAPSLLEEFPNSKIIWMIRDYEDMIASSITKFGLEVPNYMKNLILSGSGNNWLSKRIPSETLSELTKLNVNSFSHQDWMALIWWSVNRTLFINQFDTCNNFLLVQYERMVLHPVQTLKKVYNHIGLPFRKAGIKYIHATSIGKGKGQSLNPIVREMCEELTTTVSQLFPSDYEPR